MSTGSSSCVPFQASSGVFMRSVHTRYMHARKIRALSAVTPDMVLAYQDYIHHEYKPAGGGTLSLAYQANLLKALRNFFGYLLRTGHILRDPAADLKLPKLPRKLPRNVLSKKEVRKLLGAPNTRTSRGFRDRAVLEMLYATGMRKRELENLKIHDIDLSSRQVTIRRGKGGKDRVVPLAAKAAQVLEKYLEEHRARLIRSTGKEDGYLFLNDRGNKLSQHWPTWLLRKYLKKCGIKKHVTTHTWRHTCATHLLRNRASIRIIQELLGHESLTTTQIYTKVEISDLKRVIDRTHPREDMD